MEFPVQEEVREATEDVARPHDRPRYFSFRNMLLCRRHFVMDPEGEAVQVWSALVSSVVIYNLWAIILRIAFSEMRSQTLPSSVFLVLDFITDILFVVDIFLQFRMGYREDGILVKDANKLARHYTGKRRSLFIKDTIAAIPLSNIYFFLWGFASNMLIGIIDVSKGDIMYPILRLPKLAKWHSLSRYVTSWDMKTSVPNIHRACKLLLYLATTIHWIGCLYNIVSQYEGLGINEWVVQVPSSSHQYPFFRKYLCSMYWSTMTLTTIGATSSPNTDIEYLFTGCTFLIGVFMFATVVGNVGDVISNMNADKVEFQQKMDAIKLYMRHHRVPNFVQTKVKKWAEYSWNRTHALNNLSTLDILPFRLRAEIAKHVHLETLQKVKIFEGCEQGLLCELVIRLRSQIYSPGDYICRKGEIGREMYIINHGRVEVLIPGQGESEGGLVVATLTEGNFFGEISLLKLEDYSCNRRNADVRSVGYSELLVLSKRDLNQALLEFPEARSALEKQARDRITKSKEVQRIQEIRGESALRVVNPDLMNGRGQPGDSKTDLESKRIREREMSELRYIINELKSFDSRNVMKEMQGLRARNQELKNEVRALKKYLKTGKGSRHMRRNNRQQWKDMDVAYESASDSDMEENDDSTTWDSWGEAGFWNINRNGELGEQYSSDDEDTLQVDLKRHYKHSVWKNSWKKRVSTPITKGNRPEVDRQLIPNILHGCYAVNRRQQPLNDHGTERTCDVIVPGIYINDVSHQEPRIIRLRRSNSNGVRVIEAVSDVKPKSGTVPPLVFVDECDLGESTCTQRQIGAGGRDRDSQNALKMVFNLNLPDRATELLSDVTDIGSDSD